MSVRYGIVLSMLFLSVLCCLILAGFNHIELFWMSTKLSSPLPPPLLLADDGYVRHCITGHVIGRIPVHDGGGDTVEQRWKILGRHDDDWLAPAEHNVSERQRAFEAVFNERRWGTGLETFSGLSASGGGSTLLYAQETIATLHVVINEVKRRLRVDRVRLLDVPCGDMAWMSRFLLTRDDVDYTGFDIVADVIKHHQRKYAVTQPVWKFEHRDFVNDDSVDYGARFDLILCRMVLQHLRASAAKRALSRLSATFTGSSRRTAGYLLTTTFAKLAANVDLTVEGGFRELNLEIPPFSLRPPLCIVNDGVRPNPHFLGLWSLPLAAMAAGCDRVATVNASALGMLRSCTDWSLH